MRRLAFAAAAILAIACDSGSSSDENEPAPGAENEVEVSIDGKEDGVVRPLGTYRGEAAGAGDLVTVVLKSDKTFHRETLVTCITTPCNPIGEDGTYKFTKGGENRYIRFLDTDGQLIDRYAYELEDDTLSLRKDDSEDVLTLVRSAESWCGAPDDCKIQGAAQPRCIGEWQCVEATCGYQCGDPGVGNACEAGGGACVGLNPQGCADGVWADAGTFSCGGPVGVGCCMPRQQCAPVCGAVGSRSEGWYDGCTGERLCWAPCGGAEAKCDKIGSRSEGWYSEEGTGCNGVDLIGWDQCAQAAGE